jgi:uncharacterized protein
MVGRDRDSPRGSYHPMMEVIRFEDPREFSARAEAFLLDDEPRHNLLLGLVTTLIERPHVYEQFRLWLVEKDRRPVLAVVQTMPYNLVVSRPAAGGAVRTLARHLARDPVGFPGVVGALPEVDEFVHAWTALTGWNARVSMAQGIYRLASVIPVVDAPGAMREATPADRELLVRWVTAFSKEALEDSPFEPARMVDVRLEGKGAGLVLWEDDEPVSLAGFGGRTPNGIRIGPVYTPPGLRRRGYASALVAALSQRMLDEGRSFCFLYTDLSNPTSNRIYRDVGYQQVCDSVEYRFEQG